MSQEMRDQMIATLVLWTGWNKSVFVNKTDREILKMHDRYVGQ